MTAVIRAAQWYARRKGWCVLPLRAKAKRPITPHGVSEATRDQASIAQWQTLYGDCNVGVACGRDSDLTVIDIDPRHGGDATLDGLQDQHGRLPDTVECLTGGGGRHLYYRYRPGISNSVGKIGAGIDVRSDGGYVVAPPSVHESGLLYHWEGSSRPESTPVAAMPAWLAALAGAGAKAAATSKAPSGYWHDLAMGGVDQGSRNTEVTRLAGKLLRVHRDRDFVLGLLLGWNAGACRPPLSTVEIHRMVVAVAAAEKRRRRHAR